MKYHTVTAQVKFDITLTLAAEDEADAKEKLYQAVSRRLGQVFTWEEMSWLSVGADED